MQEKLVYCCHGIYFFNNTIIVQVRYIIIETKEFARIGYITGFFFYAPRPSPEYACGKRNPLCIGLGVGECPSNSPFLKNNGAEAHCF
jgi:hypothetical protein